jgi:hypothetical protein
VVIAAAVVNSVQIIGHFKLQDEVFMSLLFTHLISSYMMFSNCILHRFELRYEVFISSDTFFMESLINRAGGGEENRNLSFSIIRL